MSYWWRTLIASRRSGPVARLNLRSGDGGSEDGGSGGGASGKRGGCGGRVVAAQLVVITADAYLAVLLGFLPPSEIEVGILEVDHDSMARWPPLRNLGMLVPAATLPVVDNLVSQLSVVDNLISTQG